MRSVVIILGLLAVLTSAAYAASGRLARRLTEGPQFECMAVPLAYTLYRLDEVMDDGGQDASDLSLYPTVMPRGWTPIGTTTITSLAHATLAGAGADRRPAVVVCRELAEGEAVQRPAPADLPPPVENPVENPTVSPTYFDEE